MSGCCLRGTVNVCGPWGGGGGARSLVELTCFPPYLGRGSVLCPDAGHSHHACRYNIKGSHTKTIENKKTKTRDRQGDPGRVSLHESQTRQIIKTRPVEATSSIRETCLLLVLHTCKWSAEEIGGRVSCTNPRLDKKKKRRVETASEKRAYWLHEMIGISLPR